MSFATKYLPDVMAFIDDGLAPQAFSVGSTSGSAINVAGTAPLRKLGFMLQLGSGSTSAGVATLSIFTATASNGTFASFTTLAASSPCSQSAAVSSAGKWFLYTELRDEAITDLATNGYWVKPIVVVAGVPLTGSLTTLGFVSGSEPASNFNSATLGGFFTNYLM